MGPGQRREYVAGCLRGELAWALCPGRPFLYPPGRDAAANQGDDPGTRERRVPQMDRPVGDFLLRWGRLQEGRRYAVTIAIILGRATGGPAIPPPPGRSV